VHSVIIDRHIVVSIHSISRTYKHAQDRRRHALFPQFGAEAVAGPLRLPNVACDRPKGDVQVFYPNARYPSLLTPRSRIYKISTRLQPPRCPSQLYNFPALPLVSRPFTAGWPPAPPPHVKRFAPDIIFSASSIPTLYRPQNRTGSLGATVAMSIGSTSTHRIHFAMHTRHVLRESDYLVTVCGDLRTKAIAKAASRTGPAPSSMAAISRSSTSTTVSRQGRSSTSTPRRSRRLHRPHGLRKAFSELVQARVSLHNQRPNLHAYLVGDGIISKTGRGGDSFKASRSTC